MITPGSCKATANRALTFDLLVTPHCLTPLGDVITAAEQGNIDGNAIGGAALRMMLKQTVARWGASTTIYSLYTNTDY